jgi:hypothetical protein
VSWARSANEVVERGRERGRGNTGRVRERLPENARHNERFFLISCPKEDPLEWVLNQCEPSPQDSHII